MTELVPIYLPKESASDEVYLLVELAVDSGSYVDESHLVAVFEGSKATYEIESPKSGYFFTALQENQEVSVGGLVGYISDTDNIPNDTFMQTSQNAKVEREQNYDEDISASLLPRISKPAQRLIDEHDIDISVFVGMELVRTEDVKSLLTRRKLDFTKTPIQPETFPASDFPKLKVYGQSIILVGGGRHAKMCIDLIRQIGAYEIIGIVDSVHAVGQIISGISVIGHDDEDQLMQLYSQGIRLAVNAIGSIENHPVRSQVYRRLKKAGLILPNLIHPSAVVEPSVRMGEGNQVMMNASVGSYTTIGNNCIINSGSVVSHDSVLHDNVHVAPGALLAGGVKVLNNTLIGMGVTVYMDLIVGSGSIISNGIDLFSDVADNTIVRH